MMWPIIPTSLCILSHEQDCTGLNQKMRGIMKRNATKGYIVGATPQQLHMAIMRFIFRLTCKLPWKATQRLYIA